MVVGGIVGRHRSYLLAELRLPRVEVGKDIKLDAVLIIQVDEESALRKVVAAGVIEGDAS